MKDRDLKSYVEKAKKKVEKENGKPHKKAPTSKSTRTEEKIDGESEENNDEYEKARQLAEKYY
jgi:hemerythrin-like domain-containing protein